MKSNSLKTTTLLLVSTIAVFTGRGLQGVLHDFPVRALFWDESSFASVANALGYEWSDWVTSQEVNHGIRWVVLLLGVSFLAGALIVSIPKLRRTKLSYVAISLNGLLLFLLILLATKENFWRFGYFIEHALQLGTPFLLLAFWVGYTARSLLTAMRILTAFTFIGHGLFAVGYYPVPFHFLLMTMEGLGEIYLNFTGAMLTETVAMLFLRFVGWLDFLAAALLLIPWQKIGFPSQQKQLILSVALTWIIPWAILTTLARWWSNSGFSSFGNLLFYWGPEVLIRLPHVLIPLLVWWLIRGDTPAYVEKN